MAEHDTIRHIFICGSKGLGNYGGYETFVDRLTEYHAENIHLTYHIACKANGDGYMDEDKLEGVTKISDTEFRYHNAHCFKIHVPNIGAAQAIYYDIEALKYCIRYCVKHRINSPVFYILACRIGPFIGKFRKQIRQLGGKLYINPDGHEWARQKWSLPIRKYWKMSEKLMVKNADYVVCDSLNIEKYIQNIYKKYQPQTCYIAYGSDVTPSVLGEDEERFTKWLKQNGLKPKKYYLAVGRFVPENSFETMIAGYMKSHSQKDFALITTTNDKFLAELEERLHFKKDKRIKFTGTVYDRELLKKIRESAYGYFHGHTVGGTNPSLLEALGSTDLNLLVDVGFNREVGGDAALYWKKEKNALAELIDLADRMDDKAIAQLGKKAKERIMTSYSWTYICKEYERLWLTR